MPQVPMCPFTPLWHNKTSSNFLLSIMVLDLKNHPFQKKKTYLKLAINHKSPPPVFFIALVPNTAIFPEQGLSRNRACHRAAPVTEQGLSRSRACHRPGRVMEKRVSRTSACHGAGRVTEQGCHGAGRVTDQRVSSMRWSGRQGTKPNA